MKRHLAIFKGDSGEQILQGKKLSNIRFSKAKLAPFGNISSGDLVYIKPSGKDVIGQFKVKKVIFYNGLDSQDLKDLEEKYNQEGRETAKYATLIFIGEAQRFLTPPIKIPKKDLRGWVVLD